MVWVMGRVFCTVGLHEWESLGEFEVLPLHAPIYYRRDGSMKRAGVRVGLTLCARRACGASFLIRL